MTNEKILLVDDEQDILTFISYNLKKEGFEVLTALSGKEAIQIAQKEKPDLIVIDVMMPEMDGIETCHELRAIDELKDTLITFLSARAEDYSQVAGFDAGADDYIAKPIKPRLLVSKIKAILRRKNNVSEPVGELEIEVGNIKIDREKYLVYQDENSFALPKKEFELLALLMSKPGKVFTREVILETIWGTDVVVGDRTIDVHIRKLREKLGDKYIETIKGVGYKLKLVD
ncbi:MAG: response regulator transcription factor [Flavobacteriales bacterium]|nr:response regulator transcription factor [Flavobacteriales bacterium]MCW8911774.1 response regulator transcription factor [Flavobacteriales bacterium]MCW8938975.1 response regulator transcription factor [Flavobacteriales bacterium]MCW8968964.1 response regulator transcription factor [Flavobacteriales bacterium]MCW8989761.1 response regulator transcription factor [Flavobacteriales bacterium]